MKPGTRNALLTVGTTAMLFVGVALVLLGDATVATVGIPLVIASAIAFLVDAKDLVVKTDEGARE